MAHVLHQRAAGLSVRAAIEQAGRRTGEPDPSVFAALRRSHPELLPQPVRKATLLALTRAVEDECCARAERPVLFGAFQQQRHYRRAHARWAELARTAYAAVVFADFPRIGEHGLPDLAAGEIGRPIEIPLPPPAPMRREWAVICDATDYPACIAAWERPGQDVVADRERRFEMIWTLDPGAVRAAARICTAHAGSAAADLGQALTDQLAGTPPAASRELHRAADLLSRMVAYLDAIGPGTGSR